MKLDKQATLIEEEVCDDFSAAATEDVLAVSEQLIQQNKKLYEELAK